jgi:hypothetical protein
MRPRRNLPALFHQFPRPIFSNRLPAFPTLVMLLTVSLSVARRHKIRPASMVHPDPTLVGSPRISLLASRPAPLLHQLHAAPRIHLTEVPPSII